MLSTVRYSPIRFGAGSGSTLEKFRKDLETSLNHFHEAGYKPYQYPNLNMILFLSQQPDVQIHSKEHLQNTIRQTLLQAEDDPTRREAADYTRGSDIMTQNLQMGAGGDKTLFLHRIMKNSSLQEEFRKVNNPNLQQLVQQLLTVPLQGASSSFPSPPDRFERTQTASQALKTEPPHSPQSTESDEITKKKIKETQAFYYDTYGVNLNIPPDVMRTILDKVASLSKGSRSVDNLLTSIVDGPCRLPMRDLITDGLDKETLGRPSDYTIALSLQDNKVVGSLFSASSQPVSLDDIVKRKIQKIQDQYYDTYGVKLKISPEVMEEIRVFSLSNARRVDILVGGACHEAMRDLILHGWDKKTLGKPSNMTIDLSKHHDGTLSRLVLGSPSAPQTPPSSTELAEMTNIVKRKIQETQEHYYNTYGVKVEVPKEVLEKVLGDVTSLGKESHSVDELLTFMVDGACHMPMRDLFRHFCDKERLGRPSNMIIPLSLHKGKIVGSLRGPSAEREQSVSHAVKTEHADSQHTASASESVLSSLWKKIW